MLAALEHFAPHHRELRQRLIRSCLAILITSICAYFFKDQIAAFCMQPLFQAYPALQRLVYTRLTEAFITYIKLALLTGVIVSFPYILYQIWMFVAPGLLESEKKRVRRIILWASCLFVGGALFSFFVALPRILTFFMSYAGSNLTPMPRLGAYLTFVGRMVLAFGIAFEIPFLMVMTSTANLVSKDHFQKKRIHFYILIAILAFLLSAGELTATVLLTLPLCALYEAGILAIRIFVAGDSPES